MLVRDITVNHAPIQGIEPLLMDAGRSSKGRRHFGFFIGGGIGLVMLLASFYFSRADAISFYPTSCLGTWIDTKHAEGVPDDRVSKLASFGADIFCGSFRGDIPADTVPKSFVLKFAWRLADAAAHTPSVESVDSDEVASTSVDALPVEAQVVEEVSEMIPSEDEVLSLPQEEASQENIMPPVEESIEVSPEDSSEPVSWLDWIIRPANAQNLEVSSTTSFTEIVDDSVSSTTLAESATTSAEFLAEGREALLEVYYTLDGSVWQSLGVVDRVSLPTIEFHIPLETWSDLERVQVRIVSLPTVLEVPTVELDSVWIETVYIESAEDRMTPPDFRHDVLLDTQTADSLQAVKMMRPQGEAEIWYRMIREDGSGGDWQYVAGNEYLVERNTPLSIHSHIIFWASEARDVLYGFHTLAGGYQSQSYGEDGRVTFDFRDLATEAWQVIFREIDGQFEFLRVVPTVDDEGSE